MDINEILRKHALWLSSDGKKGEQADLTDSNLNGVDLTGADLRKAMLTGASLINADLTEAKLDGACLERAKMEGVKLNKASLAGTSFDEADLSKAELKDVELDYTSFAKATLKRAYFREVNARNVNFCSADISCANIYVSFFTECNFSQATAVSEIPYFEENKLCLHLCVFKNCNLYDIQWNDSCLYKTRFLHSELIYSGFQLAEFNKVVFCRCDMKGFQADDSRMDWVSIWRCKAINASMNDAGLFDSHINGCDFRDGKFKGTNFSDVKLINTDLSSAILTSANMQTTHLGKNVRIATANVYGLIPPSGMMITAGLGSENRYTAYDAVNDVVCCGCWEGDTNSLDEFHARVEHIYGEDGVKPNELYYTQYMMLIDTFVNYRAIYKRYIEER